MNKTTLPFSGTVPQNYDDLLGPLLFDPYALDLVKRIKPATAKNVLELACGTGRLTNHLLEILNPDTVLTATDLNPDMLTIARTRIFAPNLQWETVDMTGIPYQDESFDLVICQYGIMLVPDKEVAIKEIFRVLKKGGQLIFNVWGNVADNAVWDISSQIFNSFFDKIAWDLRQGPFSMENKDTGIKLLQNAGFQQIKIDSVSIIGEAADAGIAAKGFLQGLPIASLAGEKGMDLLPKIQEALKKELVKKLGDGPFRSPLHAWIFEAVK